MDTFFQEMLGGVGRLQENVGVTLFLEDTDKNTGKLHTERCYKHLRLLHVFT